MKAFCRKIDGEVNLVLVCESSDESATIQAAIGSTYRNSVECKRIDPDLERIHRAISVATGFDVTNGSPA